jgi:hypothetical protein
MKLNMFEREDRKSLLADMRLDCGIVFTDENFSITVVAVPACGRTDSEFVHVAVAQCSPGDAFKRKRGELVALERWMRGCTLSVRRNGRCLQDVAQDTIDFLTM